VESLKLLAPGQMLDARTLDFFARYASSFKYSVTCFNALNAIFSTIHHGLYRREPQYAARTALLSLLSLTDLPTLAENGERSSIREKLCGTVKSSEKLLGLDVWIIPFQMETQYVA